MSLYKVTKMTDDGLKAVTQSVHPGCHPELIKALETFYSVTEENDQEPPEIDAEQAYTEALAKSLAMDSIASAVRNLRRWGPTTLRVDSDTYNQVLTDVALELTDRAGDATRDFNKIK